MSYGGSSFDAGGPRPRSSGIGCMLLLVVGILFLYITAQNARRAALEPGVEPSGRTLPSGPIEPTEPMQPGPSSFPVPQQRDVPVERQAPKKTEEGDWSIEEVETETETVPPAP